MFQNSDLGQPAGLVVVVVGEVVYLVVDGAEVGVLGHPTVAADAADVAGGVIGVGGVVASFDAQGGEEDVVHGRHPVVGVVGELVAHFATVAVRAVFYSTDIPHQRRTALRQRKI